MAQSAGKPVSATDQLSQLKLDIHRTRLRASDTLAAIDARLTALTRESSPGEMRAVRAREGGVVGLVAATAVGAGRLQTSARRLAASPRVPIVSTITAAILGVAILAAVRRRRRAARQHRPS